MLRECHDIPISGHVGRDKTLQQVSRLFYWPTLRKDVIDYCTTCTSCQQSKSSTQAPGGLLQPLPLPTERFEHITMDFIVDLPETARGFNAVFTIVDKLTKLTHWVPCRKDSTAQDIARLFFRHWYTPGMGMPRKIISDRDSKFLSNFWKALHKLCGTQLAMSTAFHPQSDGQSERSHRTLLDMLRNFVGQLHDDSDELLPAMEFVCVCVLQRAATRQCCRDSPLRGQSYAWEYMPPWSLPTIIR